MVNCPCVKEDRGAAHARNHSAGDPDMREREVRALLKASQWFPRAEPPSLFSSAASEHPQNDNIEEGCRLVFALCL